MGGNGQRPPVTPGALTAAVMAMMRDDEPTQGAPCTRSNCRGTALWIPRLRVWAVGAEHRDDNYLELRFPLPTCEDCRGRVKIADLINAHSWRFLKRELRKNGLTTPPDRSSLKLVFEPMVGGHA